jgi:uncharacterized protein
MKRIQIALSILAACAIVGIMLIQQTARAQVPGPTPAAPVVQPRTVTVNGFGQTSRQPNQALVSLGVQTDATTASQALARNQQQMTALLNALKSNGVAQADIRTQGLSLFPRYQQVTNRQGATTQQLVGYTASNVASVRIRDLNKVGQILDAAVRAGSNTIQGIQFEVSDPAAATDEARALAMSDARHRAEQLAALANVGLGDVLAVSEVNASQPVPLPAAGIGAGGGGVEPGTQSIGVQIQVTWELSGTPGISVTLSSTSPTSTVSPTLTLTGTATETTTVTPSPLATTMETSTQSVTGTATTAVTSTMSVSATVTAAP